MLQAVLMPTCARLIRSLIRDALERHRVVHVEHHAEPSEAPTGAPLECIGAHEVLLAIVPAATAALRAI